MTVLRRVLAGGTASGKKALAADLALRHGLTVLSMDSMKVYRGMDLGTDKPDPALRAAVPYRLLDLVGHDEGFSAGRWLAAAQVELAAAGERALFAGGTPLYLRLLLRGVFPGPPADEALRAELSRRWDVEGEAVLRAGLAAVDPVAEARLLPRDKKRILRALEVQALTGRSLSAWQAQDTVRPISGRFVVAALRRDPAEHQRDMERRVARMVRDGLLDEVRALAAAAPFAAEPGRAIGYAEALAVLAERLPRRDLEPAIVRRTRQLGRKQRGFLASHAEVNWIDIPAGASALDMRAEVEAALEL